MEVAVLCVLVLCLAVLIRRSYRRGAPAALCLIGDPVAARRALVVNADAFANRPSALFPVALAIGRRGERTENLNSVSYGPHWRALRCNLTAGTLHPSRLGGLEPLRRQAVQALLAGDWESSAVVVRDRLYAAIFAMVARLCFGDGVDGGHVRHMQRVIQGFVLAVGEVKALPATKLARLIHWRQLRRLFSFQGQQAELFLPLVAARRQRQAATRSSCDGRRPYVDSLIDLRVPDGDTRRALTDYEMVSLVSEFLGAGTGTVVSCLEWTLAHLIIRPEAQERLRHELRGHGHGQADKSLRGMPYLHAVVLESLRMHPPVPFVLRQVHADDAGVLGQMMTAGDHNVNFVVGDIGRDSKTWTDAGEFRPERFLTGGEGEGVGPLPGPKEIRMMPFGAGHRFCPGIGLAMANIKCFLAALVTEFEWSPPAEGREVDLAELDAFFKTMKRPLLARAIRPRTYTIRACSLGC